MKIVFTGVATIILLIVSIYVWRHEANRPYSADLKLISLKSLESKMNNLYDKERVVRSDEPDAVSEKITKSLFAQLKTLGKDGNELAENLAACSAIHASKMQGDKSSCFDGYSGEADPACLIKQGYGRKSVGQVLTADRFDLNGDGIPDYIITDRYFCGLISANQAQVHLVMLSHTNGDFRMAFADWVFDRFNVVEDPISKAKVLIERHVKAIGAFSTIMQLQGEKYVRGACIFEDEHGFSRCGN